MTLNVDEAAYWVLGPNGVCWPNGVWYGDWDRHPWRLGAGSDGLWAFEMGYSADCGVQLKNTWTTVRAIIQELFKWSRTDFHLRVMVGSGSEVEMWSPRVSRMVAVDSSVTWRPVFHKVPPVYTRTGVQLGDWAIGKMIVCPDDFVGTMSNPWPSPQRPMDSQRLARLLHTPLL